MKTIDKYKKYTNKYNEEKLAKKHSKDFAKEIIERGKNYYLSNNIVELIKSGNKYIAKVSGSFNNVYDVTIHVSKDDIDYFCTCPCDFNCKHEYATLLAISNHEYTTIDLKETIKEKKTNLKSLIKAIPATDLKAYLETQIGKNEIVVEMNSLSKHFINYLPFQKYEYYYNNLYNELVLNRDYKNLIDDYLIRIKKYISSNNFNEVIKILKAIINAYQDTNKINKDEYFIDIISKIGMYLRITYRKSNTPYREEIKAWIKNIAKRNYYNSYYLEDIMLSINN